VLPGLNYRTLKQQGARDPDPTYTTHVTITQALREFANEEGATYITAGLREAATPERKQAVANYLGESRMRFRYLKERDVKDDDIVRNNTTVRRVRYYWLQVGKQERYLTAYLTEEGKVADFVLDRE
jgi:hypothetical protein